MANYVRACVIYCLSDFHLAKIESTQSGQTSAKVEHFTRLLSPSWMLSEIMLVVKVLPPPSRLTLTSKMSCTLDSSNKFVEIVCAFELFLFTLSCKFDLISVFYRELWPDFSEVYRFLRFWFRTDMRYFVKVELIPYEKRMYRRTKKHAWKQYLFGGDNNNVSLFHVTMMSLLLNEMGLSWSFRLWPVWTRPRWQCHIMYIF